MPSKMNSHFQSKCFQPPLFILTGWASHTLKDLQFRAESLIKYYCHLAEQTAQAAPLQLEIILPSIVWKENLPFFQASAEPKRILMNQCIGKASFQHRAAARSPRGELCALCPSSRCFWRCFFGFVYCDVGGTHAEHPDLLSRQRRSSLMLQVEGIKEYRFKQDSRWFALFYTFLASGI